MNDVADIWGHNKPSRTYRAGGGWVLPEQLIGLEFEYENVILNNIGLAYRKFYTSHPDGSLRDLGVEFVLSEPIFGEDLTSAIDLMGDIATRNKFDPNYRTSVHVHIDVRDLSSKEVFKMFLFYLSVERALFNFVGKERERNNYCVPWYRSNSYFKYVSSFNNNKLPSNVVRDSIKNMHRYAALNLVALSKQGSLEFRHMGGTLDMQKVKDWINLIMCLKKATKTILLENYDILLHLSRIGAPAFVQSIFGDRLKGCFTQEEIWEGVMEAQNLLVLGEPAEFGFYFGGKSGGGKLVEKLSKRSPATSIISTSDAEND